MDTLRRKAAITGIGYSTAGRKTMRPPMAHLAEAALEAISDAGLVRDDIDGVACYPGRVPRSAGFGPVGTEEAINALGLQVRWYMGGMEGAAQASGLINAVMAVATGMARHVLAFRCLNESSAQPTGRKAQAADKSEIDGWRSWLISADSVSPANWAAIYADRIMHEFGLTREMLGTQAVWQRASAQFNPRAVFQGRPLTMSDYLNARVISDPLGLFDCDVPIDAATAFIVSAADAARDARSKPVFVEAASASLNRSFTWHQHPDLTTMASHDVGPDLWKRSSLKPADVQVAGLYDGFSIFVPMWLEALGFCGRGEGGPFIAEGRTQPGGGGLVVNPCGGQLSAGRLHGYGLLHEVCLQLRGEAGERQTPDAQVGVVAMGGGPLAGAVLLTTD